MTDHLPAHRAIVVFVVDAATAAREVGLQRDDHVGVLIAIVFAVDDSPARGGLAFEAAAGVHVSLLAHGDAHDDRRNLAATHATGVEMILSQMSRHPGEVRSDTSLRASMSSARLFICVMDQLA